MNTFIIAEIGINHNGSIDLAKKLILAARYAGADAVKFQKRTIDLVYTKEELDKPRESPWGTTNRQQKEGLEFGYEEYDEIYELCKKIDMQWFVSPWDLESFKFIKQRYNPALWKVASARVGHTKLLQAIAETGAKTYISTGMSTLEEIQEAINIFKFYVCPFELMHCNSQYPADDKELNLNCILTLKKQFDCEVGYSCHSTGITPAISAVALDASSIEKHLTLDRAMYGSDQAASVEPDGFKRMVDYIRLAEIVKGSGDKIVTEASKKCREKLWRTEDVIPS